jgi:hypothetical protein
MKRLHREREKPVNNKPPVVGPTIFECSIDYQPGYDYIRQEIIDLITPHREVLCFFAQAAGEPRCVLGVDFDRYDAESRRVPVYVLNQEMIRLLMAAEGREFKRAYRDSRCGRDILVTFTAPGGRGWFVMKWQLSPERVRDLRGVDRSDA